MDILSDTAINIIKHLHKECLDYETEYKPLIDAAQKLAEYEIEEDQGYIIRLPCKVGNTLYTNLIRYGLYTRETNKIHMVQINYIHLEGRNSFLRLDILIMIIIWCLILVILEKQYFIHVKKRKKR